MAHPHACTDPTHHVHDAAGFVGAVERACGERGLRLTPIRLRVLGLVAGSVVGGVVVGRRAHAAEAEFAALRARARHEEPVQPTGGPIAPPVEQGASVFGRP